MQSIADWSDEELGALQFASDVEEVRASRESQQVLVDLVREASGEEEARARWAVRLVLSRSFTLSAPTSGQPIGGGDQKQRWFQALIPFIDMANHAPDSVPVRQSASHAANNGSAGSSSPTPILRHSGRPARATASWRVAQVIQAQPGVYLLGGRSLFTLHVLLLHAANADTICQSIAPHVAEHSVNALQLLQGRLACLGTCFWFNPC